MNSLKCDTCGAPLELSKDKTHAVCKFCGSTLLFTETDEGAVPFIENMSKERLLFRGYTELEECNEERADELFERALNLDPECAEAYWGQMLAKHSCVSTEDFVKQQIQKSHNAPLLSLSPFAEENEQEINKAIDTYVSDGLVTAGDIRSLFIFHEDYLSLLDSREYIYDQTITFFNKDKYVKRALQYADEEFRTEILSAKSQILTAIEKDIEDAKQHDKEVLENLRNPFNEHLKAAHKKAEELVKAARKRKAQAQKENHPKFIKKEQAPSRPASPLILALLPTFIIILIILLLMFSEL